MKARKVAELAKGLLVDVDGAIAGDPRDEAARHSAAASAAILATRLLGSIAINIARIADSLEGIEAGMETEDEPCGTQSSES